MIVNNRSIGDGSPLCRQPEEHSLGNREDSQGCPLADTSANLLNTDQKLKEQPSDPLTDRMRTISCILIHVKRFILSHRQAVVNGFSRKVL